MKKIRIVKDKRQLLCLAILYYVLFIGFFTWNFGIPETVYYLTDILIIALLLLCLRKIPRVLHDKEIRAFTNAIIALITLGTISAVFQSFNMALWLWSIRNWGRMIVFFYLCCSCLKLTVIDRVLSFFVKLYDVNTIVIIIQFLFLKSRYGADQLNGLFGRSTSSVNVTVSLLAFCIVISGYFAKKISIKRLIITILEIATVAVIAELRAIIIFVAVISIVYILVNFKFTIKQFLKYVALSMAVVAVLVIASNYLVRLYPQFAGFLNIRRIIADATIEGGYGYTGYIDRLNAIPVINKYFFDKMGILNKLFGIGMGNAEYSAMSFLTSSFYSKYGETFRYLNFTSSMIYLETGICGLILYTCSFVSLFWRNTKLIKKSIGKTNNTTLFYDNIGMGTTVISIIFIIYNNIQRTDAAVLLGFFLAVPYIAKKGFGYGR